MTLCKKYRHFSPAVRVLDVNRCSILLKWHVFCVYSLSRKTCPGKFKSYEIWEILINIFWWQSQPIALLFWSWYRSCQGFYGSVVSNWESKWLGQHCQRDTTNTLKRSMISSGCPNLPLRSFPPAPPRPALGRVESSPKNFRFLLLTILGNIAETHYSCHVSKREFENFF